MQSSAFLPFHADEEAGAGGYPSALPTATMQSSAFLPFHADEEAGAGGYPCALLAATNASRRRCFISLAIRRLAKIDLQVHIQAVFGLAVDCFTAIHPEPDRPQCTALRNRSSSP